MNISIGYPENPRLGMWLGTQRMAKKSGTLADERVKLLTDLGVVWSPREAAWQENYRTLSAIKAAGGDVNIPQKFRENRSLGSWLNEQRMAKKKGALSPDRAARLEALGVVWELRKKRDA